MTKRLKPPKDETIERRAMNASHVLNSAVYKEAVATLEAFYIKELIDSTPDEVNKREHLHKSIHALRETTQTLTAYVQSGTIQKSMELKSEKAKQ